MTKREGDSDYHETALVKHVMPPQNGSYPPAKAALCQQIEVAYPYMLRRAINRIIIARAVCLRGVALRWAVNRSG